MTTTFETAKIGDKVWCIRLGWGEIQDTNSSIKYPIYVDFQNGDFESYTLDGLYDEGDVTQSLFWDEVKIEAPKKPMPSLEVDAKVLVWNSNTPTHKRHFSHFNESGKIECFSDGMTSWVTEHTREWESWKLVD